MRDNDAVRGVELWVQQLVEVLGLDAHHRLGTREADVWIGGHLDRYSQRGAPGALADTRLEHPELALLDRELGVEHVAVVALEPGEDVVQLRVDLGEVVGEGREREGRADAGHDVLALGVHEEVAVRALRPGRRVAGEAHPGPGVVVAVAEHHGLHVHRGAEVVGDVLPSAVRNRPGAVPRREHRLDRDAELAARVLGERLAGDVGDDLLRAPHDVAQQLRRHLGVGGHAGEVASRRRTDGRSGHRRRRGRCARTAQ